MSKRFNILYYRNDISLFLQNFIHLEAQKRPHLFNVKLLHNDVWIEDSVSIRLVFAGFSSICNERKEESPPA